MSLIKKITRHLEDKNRSTFAAREIDMDCRGFFNNVSSAFCDSLSCALTILSSNLLLPVLTSLGVMNSCNQLPLSPTSFSTFLNEVLYLLDWVASFSFLAENETYKEFCWLQIGTGNLSTSSQLFKATMKVTRSLKQTFWFFAHVI